MKSSPYNVFLDLVIAEIKAQMLIKAPNLEPSTPYEKGLAKGMEMERKRLESVLQGLKLPLT